MGFMDFLMGKPADNSSMRDAAAQATAQIQKILDEYEGVELPDWETLTLERPELVGLLEAAQLDPSAFETISTDPRLRESQLKALSGLEEISTEGMTKADEAALRTMRRQADAADQARQQALLQSFAERGAGGSGVELAARLSGQQSTSAAASESADRIAMQKAAARQAALQQVGAMAGGIEASDYGRQADLARARDAIQAFNKQNLQNVQAQNLAARQAIENQRAGTANQQEMIRRGQGFQDQMALLAGKGGAATGMASALYNQGKANVKPGTTGFLPIWGGIVGGAGGAALTGGNPMATAAGFQLGSTIGGGASNMYKEEQARNFADGGVVEPKMSAEEILRKLQEKQLKAAAEKEQADNIAAVSSVGKSLAGAMQQPTADVPEMEEIKLAGAPVQVNRSLLQRYMPQYANGGTVEKPSMMLQQPVEPQPTLTPPPTLNDNMAALIAARSQQPQKFEEGGIVRSFNNTTEGTRAEWSTHGDVQNLEEIAGPMPKSAAAYFKKTFEDNQLLDTRPMFKDGGCVKDKYAEGGMIDEDPIKKLAAKRFESSGNGDIVDGTSYVGDRVDAGVNSGEIVLNLEQQQRLMDMLKGDKSPEEMPEEDIVRPASEEETNLHEKNSELEARIAALEAQLAKLGV